MDHAPILEAAESESEIQTQGDVSSLTDTNSPLWLERVVYTQMTITHLQIQKKKE